jgi:hypothetical protein
MVRQEGGRWDVGTQNNAVYLERISENDKRLFDDLLAPEEARELAELLTKYAAKLEKADSNKTDDSNDARDSEESDDEDSDDGEDSDEDSHDSDKSSN